MASNATLRIENQDMTCLVQILLSHTFYPDHFVPAEKHKITLLACFFILKNEQRVKATSSDSALVW